MRSSGPAAQRPGNAYDYLFKIVLVGDSSVGKSSLVVRFTEDKFSDEVMATVGVDFKLTTIDVPGGGRVRLTVWDTAGQERFRALTPSYYRGAQAVIFCYDVSKRETFEALDHWLRELENVLPDAGAGLVKLVVGNKIDVAERAVDRSDGEAWARRRGALFAESSAKESVGVKEVFHEVVYKILDTPALLATALPGPSNLNVRGDKQSDHEPGLCC